MFKLAAVALLCLVSVSIVSAGCPPQTACEVFWTRTCATTGPCVQFDTHEAMITAVVVGAFTTSVATTTDAKNPAFALKRYFDGTYGGNTINFITNSVQQARLVAGLVNFFGVTLECKRNSDCYDEKWNSTGHPFVPLTTAHAGLKIRQADLNLFNKVVADVIASVHDAADTTDTVFTDTLTTVGGVLASTKDAIVYPATLSICDRYSGAGSNFDLLDLIVNKTVTSVVSDAALVRYFDGSISGTAKILSSTTLVRHLEDGLVYFFGAPTVLGCTDRDFPAYTGADMKVTHAKLNVSAADFKNFNDRLVAVLNVLGVSTADQTAVRSVLDSTGPAIICNGNPCSVKAPSSASGVVASAVVTVAAVAAAFL